MGVELAAVRAMIQPTKVMTFDASALFHDPDGDDLMYTITGVTPDVSATADRLPDTMVEPQCSEPVVRSGAFTRRRVRAYATDDLEQSISINPSTGEITYITDLSHGPRWNGWRATMER